VTSSMPSTVGQCVWTGPEPAIGHLRPPLTPTLRGDREALGWDVDLVLVVVVFARTPICSSGPGRKSVPGVP
jgi:hypothetical protein